MPAADVFDRLCQFARETGYLASATSLMGWDERTYMPPGGGAYRAEQTAYFAALIHRRVTSPELGDMLAEAAGRLGDEEPHGERATIVRQLKRQYDRAVKLPESLVRAIKHAAVLGQQIWDRARKADDFEIFRPQLTEIVRLKCEEADALGHDGCRYDALLDDYEPYAKTADVAAVLEDLRGRLVPLVASLIGSARKAPLELLRRSFPAAMQERFGKEAAARFGFDFDKGRLDVTHHPFCSEMGPGDCRITTRYDERFFPSAFFSILHEAGHGIYQQGLPEDRFGLPTGESVSLGIHESQSRMWENLVGRSRAFWRYWYPRAQAAFPAALKDVSLDDFHFAVNDVRPSLIRVEADEATYNLHIIVRFELEQALLDEELSVADLPGAWREKYRHYLGIEPAGDADGVMQDVHWSGGMIGYFPTYTLGNLYAAQFFAAAEEQLGGLEDDFAQGRYDRLLGWLRENIHRYGQRYTAEELVRRATGKPLSSEPLMAYLRRKYEPLYG